MDRFINKIICTDVLNGLKTLPDEPVQMCVTSPPYWGLRDYGTGTWEGGDSECNHRVGGQVHDNKAPGAIVTGQRPGVNASRCKDCGAVRFDHQLGLEETPEKYIAEMVEVFREVRRVLKDDGTLWLNIGDSYWGGKGQSNYAFQDRRVSESLNGEQHNITCMGETRPQDGRHPNIKPKDLVGIPWMLAFALRSDGWYLRQDIIWHKPNPMPESMRDRCTKAHEYLFLLSKSERYFYDGDAIKEKSNGCAFGPMNRPGRLNEGGEWVNSGSNSQLRNRRSVWTVPTHPFPEAHFATFPQDLIKPCILAGSSQGDVVLDPFMGSGTTAIVAKNLGRNYIGIELNPVYAEMAERRIARETAQLNLFTRSQP